VPAADRGCLPDGSYRHTPLVYLAGLIKRANAGEFVPEAGLHVADVREKRRRNEAYLQRIRTLNDVPIAKRTEVEDNPLAKRLADIQLRSAERSKDN
jgi:hypothetical protein